MVRIFGMAATAVAALSLAATPAIAAQGSASKLSLRASTASEKESDLAGAPIIAILGVAAIVAGGVIIATQDDDPDSP
ncbi:hypothetical protein [Sphingomonas psychrotolerans]|uniref:Uncharacterized protein n=1 Tax=Sphingomonas psychrotolerans TaxID=1327635 RepID=A0A2K8MRQ6_9SPHN|nr:hypothetical protein [Sphingomonas psychrotolerans]ATY34151.1 hypothetical protein CVN68_21130 [Sphingomonas psychrotolerans]